MQQSAIANVAQSQTDAVLVAKRAGYRIRARALNTVASAATTVTFNTKGTVSAAISPAYAQAANSGVTLPYSPVGWFESGVNEDLTCTTGAGGTTGILLVFSYERA